MVEKAITVLLNAHIYNDINIPNGIMNTYKTNTTVQLYNQNTRKVFIRSLVKALKQMLNIPKQNLKEKIIP